MRFKGSVLVITAVLFLTGGALLFASGQNEPTGPQGTGSGRSVAAPTVATNLVTVTGQVQLVNLMRPVVTNGSTKYELLVPRYEVYRAGVTQGQTVTVKGYEVQGGSWGPYFGAAGTTDTTPKLLVSSATVGGKSYDLTAWADHFKAALQDRGAYGRGFRGQGYGPGYGPMFGYGPRGRGGYGHDFHGWYGPGYGRGFGPMMGPGFGPGYGPYGPGMGFRYQGGEDTPNQGQ